jgi:predicted peroxiredoxin
MSIVDILDPQLTAVMIAGMTKGIYVISKREYDKLADKTVIDELLKKHTLNVSTVVVDSGKGKNSAEQLRRIKEYGVEKEVAEISATVAKIREKCGSALVFYFK